jgi:hypothetical protein
MEINGFEAKKIAEMYDHRIAKREELIVANKSHIGQVRTSGFEPFLPTDAEILEMVAEMEAENLKDRDRANALHDFAARNGEYYPLSGEEI